jgi:spermidine/putrescine transport system permease protein
MRRLFTYDTLALLLGTASIAWQLFFFYIPLLVVLVWSLLPLSTTTTAACGSYGHFLQLPYAHILLRSLGQGFLTVALCFVLAYPLAYCMTHRAGAMRMLLLGLLIIPFFTNFLLHVYAWHFVLDSHGLVSRVLALFGLHVGLMHTRFSVQLMMVYHYLPFMVLPLYSAFEKLDRRLIEASLDLGASWLQTVTRIVMPMTLSGIRLGFFLVFVPACAEFAIPELMGGDRVAYVGTVIAHTMLGVETMALGAAATVLSCVAIVCAALLSMYTIDRLIMRWGRS